MVCHTTTTTTTLLELIHHAEKPDNFVSDLINCGIYIFASSFKSVFEAALRKKS
jgi:mannose-1-phosphate guanylyltransferase